MRTKRQTSAFATTRWCAVIVSGGMLIQFITVLTQDGYLHSDQHFQYIEFAAEWLGMKSYAPSIWEYDAAIRPTIGIYAIAILYRFFALFGEVDPYSFHTTLRMATALGSFALFNMLAIFLLRDKGRLLLLALILLNFTWCFPYVRTLAGSEVWGGLLFFWGISMYLRRYHAPGPLTLLAIGFVLSLSFFFRFQMGFSILACLLWILVYRSDRWRQVAFAGTGFILGLAFNIVLDSAFYQEFVLTPVRYFEINILEGKAAEFGTSPPTFYFAELLVVLFAPFISLYLFYHVFRGMFLRPNIGRLLTWVFLLFLIGHTLVAHKEERFLFPMFGILPLLVAYAYDARPPWLGRMAGSRFVRFFVLPVSVVLNFFALTVLMFLPYSQTIAFSKEITRMFNTSKEQIDIYYLDRGPFESSSHLVYMFYYNNLGEHIAFHCVNSLDDLRAVRGDHVYFCGTYNNITREMSADRFSQQFPEEVCKSSQLLWSVNRFLDARGASTIEDIWVLTRLSGTDH